MDYIIIYIIFEILRRYQSKYPKKIWLQESFQYIYIYSL